MFRNISEKSKHLGNMRQLQSSNLCHKILGVQGRGRGRAGRKRTSCRYRVTKEEGVFPVSWLVVCLLAASRGRGTSFLSSLQAKHSLKLPLSAFLLWWQQPCQTPCS